MNGSFVEIELVVCENPNAEQLRPIEEGLNKFNDLMTEISDRQPLSILIKSNKNGEVLGGMQGRSSLGLLLLTCSIFHPSYAD